MSTFGVFSIEGEWRPGQPARRESVKALLTVLEDLGEIEWFHRDAATRAEVNHLLDRWSGNERSKLGGYGKYKLLYLSVHGDEDGLWIPAEERSMSLGRLATHLNGGCKGKFIHFGAGGVLNVDRSRLQDFRDRTGASLITGYTEPIDWVECAALDMPRIAYLADARPADAIRKPVERNPVLVDKLGLVTEPSYA